MDGSFGAEPGSDWRTGPVDDRGRYRVARPDPLPGGEGFVFKAEGPGGAVALKLLGAMDVERFELLHDRCQRVMDDPHPNLAKPIELFRGPGLFTGDVEPPTEDCDLVYAVAGWADGEPLRAVAPLPLQALARMAVDIASALTHLHDQCGLVHRDIHPGNVIVGEHGATLIDLGAIRPDDGGHTTTFAGTLGFIAPELTHDPGDRRADAWGLGMLAVFALLGHPKGRQSEQELRRQLSAALGEAGDRQRAIDLLLSMVADDPSRRPTDLTGWAAELRSATLPMSASSLGRRWPVAAAAVAGIAVVAAAVTLTTRSTERGPTDAAVDPTTSSTAPVGCSPSDFHTPAIAAVAGDACPSGPVTNFGDAIVQPVSSTTGEAVVVSSEVGVVLLSSAQLSSYREIAGRARPENAITFGGYPISATDDGDMQVVELSLNGVMIGARIDSQAFWLPAAVEEFWRARGGPAGDLGMPMTNPYYVEAGVMQDFALGTVLLPANIPPIPQVSPDVLVATIDQNLGSGLAGLALDGRLLRQPTGTVWYVEGATRRWVPTGEVYDCLGGDDAVVADNVAGSDVATLELGPAAACSGG